MGLPHTRLPPKAFKVRCIGCKSNIITNVDAMKLNSQFYLNAICPDCNKKGTLVVQRGRLNMNMTKNTQEFPTIEVFVDGVLKSVTTWSTTCKQARERYCDIWHIDPSRVRCYLQVKK